MRVLDLLILLDDLVLDGDLHDDEDVVLGLRLARHLHLLQPHRQRPRHLVDAGDDELEARHRDLLELAKLLDDLDAASAGDDAAARHGLAGCGERGCQAREVVVAIALSLLAKK